MEYNFAIIQSKSGPLLGGCGLNHISNEFKMANAGYRVRTNKARQCPASSAMLLLAKFAFEELGLKRIEILVDIDNKKSQNVAEKVGARWEGPLRNRICIRGNTRDVFIFSLIPDDLKKIK